MAVVRDITIEQLTQAVHGISSVGMTDTTGQDIKEAIDDLDMTAGTLGKDSSLQDIVTAIQALTAAISPAAANVTFDNTGTGLSASNVQAAIEEINTVKTTCSLTLQSGAPSNTPLAQITRRNNTVIIHFANEFPAGTYYQLYNITPAPASNQHALVDIGGDKDLVTILTNGTVRFNNSKTLASSKYVIGQIVYLTN